MEKVSQELLKRPLYVFDLPEEVLLSLRPKVHPTLEDHLESSSNVNAAQTPDSPQTQTARQSNGALSCSLCQVTFPSFTEQRRHTRSDWHGYNLKQKMQGLNLVSEVQFDKLIDDLDLSISGSDTSSSGDEDVNKDHLSTLLRKQARLRSDTEAIEDIPLKNSGRHGSPFIWFSLPQAKSDISFGIYKVLFTNEELSSLDPVEVLRRKQLQPIPMSIRVRNQAADEAVTPSSTNSPTMLLCMIGGGHFAAMVVSLAPKIGKNSAGTDERQAVVLVHKTFHRYTTRRKQGGSQSANDASKGNAHSAGAGIRRHNEAALEAEVRALLVEWKGLIHDCKLLFIRATGSTNRKTLFGPSANQILRSNDPRIKSFPFSTRRATQSELMRAFVELTRVKINEIPETTLTDAQNSETPTSEPLSAPKSLRIELSKEEQEALLHTSQLEALIRRSKAPSVVSYIKANSISPNFNFHPYNTQGHHHASTPLHLAASINSTAVVLSLLVKAGADPTILNGEGKVPLELAGERATRDAFRIARSELGEQIWDWQRARCPPPLSKAQADLKEEADRKEAEMAESARRREEMKRLDHENSESVRGSLKILPTKVIGQEMTAEDRREAEARGLTPDMRARLEREQRARAAEERIKRMTGN